MKGGKASAATGKSKVISSSNTLRGKANGGPSGAMAGKQSVKAAKKQ